MDGTLYVPHGPDATMEDGRIAMDMMLTLRTTMDSAQVTAMLQRITKGASAGIVVSDVRAMRARLADAVAAPAAATSLLAAMGALAVVLGCIGVYGVLSFLVSRQMRDFGIRLALGAQRRDIFWMVIKEGATLSAAGIVLGIAGALGVMRWLSSELYGVSPTDPMTCAAVAVLVTIVTLLASSIPTRRAMNVDPLISAARRMTKTKSSKDGTRMTHISRRAFTVSVLGAAVAASRTVVASQQQAGGATPLRRCREPRPTRWRD